MEPTVLRPIERRRAPSKLGAVRRAASGSAARLSEASAGSLADEGLPLEVEKTVDWAQETEQAAPAMRASPRASQLATDLPVDITVSSRLEVTPRGDAPSAQTSTEFELDHNGDEWLDRELAIEAEKRANARRARRAKRAKGAEAEADAAPSTATQIVNRAISHFMGGDERASPLKTTSSAFKQETNSILDKVRVDGRREANRATRGRFFFPPFFPRRRCARSPLETPPFPNDAFDAHSFALLVR